MMNDGSGRVDGYSEYRLVNEPPELEPLPGFVQAFPNRADSRLSVNPNTHPATWKSEELLSQCSFRSLRRSGPGGQHRNKVETAVILTHEPTGVKAEANEKRSQGANREVALKRLRINLAIDHRVPPQPFSSLWQVRVQRGRIMINHEHDDFPALLAELLDHWQPVKPELGELANELQTSASQLVKFLKLEPRAFALINQSRVEQGKRPLL